MVNNSVLTAQVVWRQFKCTDYNAFLYAFNNILSRKHNMHFITKTTHNNLDLDSKKAKFAGILCTGGCVGPRAGLDGCGKYSLDLF